jgi:pimeloyl-ACP methyl ester carboxylesterase
MKKEIPVTVFKSLVLVLLAVCLLSGCSWLKDLVRDDPGFYYTGKVSRETPGSGPVIVVLYTERKGQTIVLAHDLVPTQGAYHLATKDNSSHKILAFEDAGRDFVYDTGERIAYLDTPLNSGPERDPKMWGNIVIPASGGTAPSFPIDLSEDSVAQGVDNGLSTVGDIVPLNDPRFEKENGLMGYFAPYVFLEEFGPSLYMLEPYSPGRRPVVLVHGAKSTPAVFRSIISSLDKTRYQAWVYFWPTGMPINFSAWSFEEALQEMQEMHGFDRVDLIAHSMGGLMCRAAINLRTEDNRPPLVDRFITISTPWHGHASSQLGVDMSPIVTPSWVDIAPASIFLRQLYTTPLPPSTRHVLLFSHKAISAYSIFTPGNDDNSVSIESMLFYPAQDRASRVYGFDDDHNSILNDPKLIDTVNFELRQTP